MEHTNKILELPSRFLGFLGVVPLSLIIFSLISFSLSNNGEWRLLNYLSIVFLILAFIAWLWPYCKIQRLKGDYPISNVTKSFILIWINGTGFLVEKVGKDGKKVIVRWIESWQTASDLEFFGYRSIFNNDNYPALRNTLNIDEQVGKILKEVFKIEDWEWGSGIHTRGVPGS